ncbi:CYFA0S04e03290g1_1 [Cyberlindnera fabianii]|uniref:CYFA0S04e03290g1_1 n=1 Tax=Cyberlindnera fabianii TaxID=36022 RepID=A0A061AR26_CYBFA|nr:CYFA0S04e03290g1_1 [Cyberlindnera fabianii]
MSLLESAEVLQRIGSSLSMRDRLHFTESDKAISTALKVTDTNYFAQRLKRALIIHDPSFIDEDLLREHDALSAFAVRKTADPKQTCGMLIAIFAPYVDRLEAIDDISEFDDFDSFFGGKMMAEQDKARILVNLQKFIKMDDADEELCLLRTDKIQALLKVFTKAKFDDLDVNFHREEYSVVSLLVETLNILEQEELVVDFFRYENKFPLNFFPDTILDVANNLDEQSLENVIKDMIEFFNEKSKIIDQCFGQQLPVMLMYIENILELQIILYFTKECEKNIEIIPQLYYQILMVFVPGLVESENAGENYKTMVVTFINLYMEPLVVKYLNETVANFETKAVQEIDHFQKEYEEQEKLEKDHLYKSILSEYSTDEVKTNKFELLTSFTKIFAKSNNNTNEINFKLNFELINKNLKNLKNFINFELCTDIIEQAKVKVEAVGLFGSIDNSILDKKKINDQTELIFIKLVTILEQHHVKPGFENAIEILNKYDPTEFKSLETIENLNTVEPLVKFTELINIGDLIYQMLEIFYENELVKKKVIDRNEFLNNANQSKKHFEATLDGFVASGLNVGIDKLMDEVEFIYNTLQLPNDFNPKSNRLDEVVFGSTKCAIKVVEILSNHINLLNGSTEKGVIDVFQQEIGERFFQIIVKNIKKRQISTNGAIILISDLNLYYDFIVNTLRQKNITPLFAGLKEIGQLYLISSEDSKELGKLIGDLSKFNGIFKQEEIYEFVTKRTDWNRVKKDVEKAMYGLGITDCAIM